MLFHYIFGIAVFILSSLQLADAQTVLGCKNEAIPCNGNGKCNRNSVCVCDIYYTGDSCEFSIDSSERKSLQTGDIGTGGLIALVVSICFFVVFSASIFWLIWWRMKKRDKKWDKRPKSNLGTLANNPQTNLDIMAENNNNPPKDMTGLNNMMTELSQLNKDGHSRVEFRKGSDDPDEFAVRDQPPQGEPSRLQGINESEEEAEENPGFNTNRNEIRPALSVRNVDMDQNIMQEENKPENLARTKELLGVLGDHSVLGLNLMGQYSKDAQNFVQSKDLIRDPSRNIIQQIRGESSFDPRERTPEARPEHISLDMRSNVDTGGIRNRIAYSLGQGNLTNLLTPNKYGDDDTLVEEEGGIGATKSTKKFRY